MSKEAMKLALEALGNSWTEPGNKQYEFEKEAITALRGALAQPDFWEGYVPEPVKPAQQEPVAWIVEDQSGERLEWAGDAHSCHGVPTFPLYTSPPAQRTWVGLTDEEIRHINRSTMSLPIEEVLNSFARAIEAKLKEKNNGN